MLAGDAATGGYATWGGSDADFSRSVLDSSKRFTAADLSRDDSQDVDDGHVRVFGNYGRARRDLKRIYERNNASRVGEKLVFIVSMK